MRETGRVIVNEDPDDILEEVFYALGGLLTAADYLAGKGYDDDIERAERSLEQVRRYLFTPEGDRACRACREGISLAMLHDCTKEDAR